MEKWKVIQRKGTGGYYNNSRDQGRSKRDCTSGTKRSGGQTKLKRTGNQMVRQFLKASDQQTIRDAMDHGEDDQIERALRHCLGLNIELPIEDIEYDHAFGHPKDDLFTMLTCELDNLQHAKAELLVYEVWESDGWSELRNHGFYTTREKAEMVRDLLVARESALDYEGSLSSSYNYTRFYVSERKVR